MLWGGATLLRVHRPGFIAMIVGYHFSRNGGEGRSVAPVLSELLGSADPAIRDRATRLVHELGEKVSDEFGRLLEPREDGT